MAKKAKKARNAKLPKRIAGIKLNKSLRRGPLAQMLASPLGQNVIGEIIYHAGAALTERAADGSLSRNSARAGNKAARASSRVAGATYDGAALVFHAFREGTNAFISTLRHRDGMANLAGLPDEGGSMPGTRLAEEPRNSQDADLRH